MSAAEGGPQPTQDGRWGIRQINRHGENTGGGTIGLGWSTRQKAETCNPPEFGYRYEVFDRFPWDKRGGIAPCQNGEACQDGRIECWSPGGPCPTPNDPDCDLCGTCLDCASAGDRT